MGDKAERSDAKDMEKNLPELLKSGEGKYLIVNVVAKRVRKLMRGDKPLVAAEGDEELPNIALKEIQQGKIKALPRRRTGKLVDLAKQQQ